MNIAYVIKISGPDLSVQLGDMPEVGLLECIGSYIP